MEYEPKPSYQCLTVTPAGDFIVADYYCIEIIESTLKDKIQVESPIKMDSIKLHGWSKNMLLISCNEFLNWNNYVELELDSETLEITIKDSRNLIP